MTYAGSIIGGGGGGEVNIHISCFASQIFFKSIFLAQIYEYSPLQLSTLATKLVGPRFASCLVCITVFAHDFCVSKPISCFFCRELVHG